MYSILKTQKRSITSHKPNLTVTSSIFLTNSHVLFTFSDCSCIVYSLNLSQPNSQQILYQATTSSIVTDSKRIVEGLCVMVCKNISSIYILEYVENTVQHTFAVQMRQVIKSAFAQMIHSQIQTGLLNTIGCQIKLHAFANKCFVVQNFVFEDRKIFLDCYKYKPVHKNNSSHSQMHTNYGKYHQNITHNWELFTIDIDIQINGHYVLQPINYGTGQFALYKQTQITESNWVLRIFSPFANQQYNSMNLNPHSPDSETKQVKVNLPQDRFNQDTTIIQICEYLDSAYMVIVGSKTTGKLTAYSLYGLNQNSVGSIPQNAFSFQAIPANHSSFLLQNFIKIVYVNPKQEIFYLQTHKHQTNDGELYLNGLVIGNLRTGKSIERGYCTLRNIDFSPNYRYILDVPYQYDKICVDKIIYHIRLLFSKSSLYILLIENVQTLNLFSDRFKNTMIQML